MLDLINNIAIFIGIISTLVAVIGVVASVKAKMIEDDPLQFEIWKLDNYGKPTDYVRHGIIGIWILVCGISWITVFTI